MRKSKGNEQPIYCVELKMSFPSMVEAVRFLYKNGYLVMEDFGNRHTYLRDCCRGKRDTAFGFHWKYLEKPKKSNYEKIKTMSIDEMAEFLRWDILDRLPCDRSCEGSPDCQFACLKMMKLWLESVAE